jgi:hypothetical protein
MTPEGIPTLCKRCGGDARLDGPTVLRCVYCGNVEELPGDQQARIFELQSRLRIAAAQAAQLQGTEAALGRIFEEKAAFVRLATPFAFVFVISIVYAAVNVRTAFESTNDTSIQLQLVAGSLMGPFLIGGFVLSCVLALAVGRFSYARTVRPRLRARSALFPGAPMRCRACGGPLLAQRVAHVTCAYCNTTNLLSHEHAADAAKRLAEEAAEYRARAGGAVAGVGRVGVNMTRIFIICFTLTYGSVIVILGIVQFVTH